MLNPASDARTEESRLARQAAFERISSCNFFNITAEHGHQPFKDSSHCHRDWHIQVADPDYQTNPLSEEHQVYLKQVVEELAYGPHLWEQNVKPTATALTQSEMGTAIGRFACGRVFGFDDPGKGTATGAATYDKLLSIDHNPRALGCLSFTAPTEIMVRPMDTGEPIHCKPSL
jgi:hypothetical protein